MTKEDASANMVEVCNKKYPIVKTGRAQAEQVVAFGKWFGKYGPEIVDGFQTEDNEGISAMALIERILDVLSTDALIDLFGVVIGCPKKVSEECFDIAILIDVAIETYDKQPSIKRLIERFFSTPDSEQPTEDSSTESEEPTDGQTTKS